MLAESKGKKQFLYFIGYVLLGLVFIGWLAWSMELPGRCWSLVVAPKTISIHELEESKPFQVNLVVTDYEVAGKGTPVFSEDDEPVQIGTLLALTNILPGPENGDGLSPTVFVYVKGDTTKGLEFGKELTAATQFNFVTEPSTRNAFLFHNLEKQYPNLNQKDLVVLSPDGIWKSTMTILLCVGFFGLMFGGGAWQFWSQYSTTSFFLEKEQQAERKLHVANWRDGSILGVNAVEAIPFPSLPEKTKLPVFATYALIAITLPLWFGGFLAPILVLTLDIPWWGKALLALLSLAVMFGARQLMAWSVEREQKCLDSPASNSIASSIECQSFTNDLLALGFVDDCPARSIQRKFLSSPSGHVAAMTGFSTRDKCFYVSFFTFLDDGRVLQTSSKTKHLLVRSRHVPLWIVESSDETETDLVLDHHIQLVKEESGIARILIVKPDDIMDADNYLDQLSLRGVASMWRRSIWRV